MTILRRKLNEILIKAQTGSTQIYLKRLQNLYYESDFEEFLKEFLRCLNIILKAKNEHDHYRDKLLIFASKFCTSLKKTTDDSELLCPFLKDIFVHLFKEFNPDIISTYRVSQFIKLLLKEIGEQESFLDEDICIQIRDLMLERIDDIKAKVRIEAVEVLQRLQDPLDNNDIIIKAFIERLNDDHSQVRKHIVRCIGLNVVSIPVVVGRCLDVSDDVRLLTYDKLSKMPMNALKIAQRQFILRNGFEDKNQKIQSCIIKNLLPQWLGTYNGDYFQLIRALKLDADERDFKQTTTIVEKVLEELFKNTDISTIMEALPLGREKLISSDDVQWEEILFWRCLEQFLQKKEDNNLVDKILPELIFFCNFVSKTYKSKAELKSEWEIVQHDHMMLELLKISNDYDYSDEVGRNALLNLITTVLIDGPALYDVIVLLVEMFEKLIPDTEERASKFCEIIAEIQTPLTPVAPSEDMIRKRDVKLAEYRLKLNIAEYKQETAIEREDFDKASKLKKDITAIKEKMAEISKDFDNTILQRKPKTDTSTYCRCLDILTASLRTDKIRTLPESYRAFQTIFLPPLLTSREPEVFWRAVRQLCIFANFDVKLAKESMQVFCTPLMAHKFRPVYGDQTTIVAINCVTDMILIHGSNIFEAEENMLSVSQKRLNKRKILDRTAIDETVFNDPPTLSLDLVIEVLSELIDDTDDKIRETAGESLLTLMLTGRVRSALLFSKLLLKWFSPNTLKDVRLRQLIGRLFTDYVPENPYSLEVIEQAFVPTLQAIIDAPRSSPLADVDIDSVSRFLAALSQPGRYKYNVGLDAHKNIALNLCTEICDRPNNKRSHIYLKTLLYLEPPREDEVALDILRKQVETMQELVKDKHCLRYVFKYLYRLNNDYIPNDNTTSATSMNSANAAAESSVTTFIGNNTEMYINTVETQKDDTETSRYSSLSVKRKKRRSKETGEKVPNDTNGVKQLTVRLDRNLEIGRFCNRLVVSETDSEYATENDLQEHKKKQHCNITNKQITEPLIQSEEIEVCSQLTETNSECATKKHSHGKLLQVRLTRNKNIDKMCSVKTRNSTKCAATNYEQNEKKLGSVPKKQLTVILDRNEEDNKINKYLKMYKSKLDRGTENLAEENVKILKLGSVPKKQLTVVLDRNLENNQIKKYSKMNKNKLDRGTENLAEENVEILVTKSKKLDVLLGKNLEMQLRPRKNKRRNKKKK